MRNTHYLFNNEVQRGKTTCLLSGLSLCSHYRRWKFSSGQKKNKRVNIIKQTTSSKKSCLLFPGSQPFCLSLTQ